MRVLFVFILVVLLFSCSQEEVSINEITNLYGKWKGSGRFYNFDFNKEYGPLSFNINLDNTVTGTIGDAIIEECKFVRSGNRIDMLITLKGKIEDQKECEKDKIIFLLVEISNDKIVGDYHLKSNFIFDFTMRPGEFTIRKSED